MKITNPCIVWFLVLASLLTITFARTEAQIVHFGVKAGPQLSLTRVDDAGFRNTVRNTPAVGIQGGAVISFKVRERYFLHTEYLFTTKGKINRGKVDKLLEDRVVYNYFEVPVLYNVHFKGALGSDRKFKWYAGAGPLFSYWLGGKGWINADEFAENSFPPFNYKIKFGERGEDIKDFDIIYMKEVNRFQLGLNFGGGILAEPGKQKIMVDLRFEYGHTWMGSPASADYVLPVTYDDNLKARNMGVKFSVMYLLETNLNKKVRNKGKTNLKTKGKVIKKKK